VAHNVEDICLACFKVISRDVSGKMTNVMMEADV